MTKVLISGMTAPQSSKSLNEKNISFAGAICKILEYSGVEVVWQDPQVGWTIDNVAEYDAVLLGIAPVLSLTANKSYGILSLIDTMKNDQRLCLFIDAPEPSKVHASLRSASKDYSSRLFKEFYSKRKDFKIAVDLPKIVDAADYLLNEKWPTTLYPTLPWNAEHFSATGLPENVTSSFVGISVDSFYIEHSSKVKERSNRWAVESLRSSWIAKTSENLMFPNIATKHAKTDGDAEAVDVISKSIGLLIGPHDDKITWWSPRFFQAINTQTPVATEWRAASTIGNSWSHLAAGIEQMSSIDRYELAAAQREEYAEAIPTPHETLTRLHKEMRIDNHVSIIQ